MVKVAIKTYPFCDSENTGKNPTIWTLPPIIKQKKDNSYISYRKFIFPQCLCTCPWFFEKKTHGKDV